MIGLRVIFLNKNILKYNHLQPPEAAGFAMVDLILNRATYFSTESSYIYLEV